MSNAEKLTPQAMREMVDDLATRVATEVAATILAVSPNRIPGSAEYGAKFKTGLAAGQNLDTAK